jgi:hypothetical protein
MQGARSRPWCARRSRRAYAFAALSLALVAAELASTRRAFAEEPSPPGSLDQTPATPAASPAAPAGVAGPLPSRDTRWSLTLGGAVDVGSLPRASPGLALGFDVRRGALAASVVASAFLAQDDRGSRASVALYDATAMICALAPVGLRLDIGACGGLGAGLLRAVPPASDAVAADAESRLRPQGLATTRTDVALLLPSLYLSLEAGVVVDPLRTRLPFAGRAASEAPHRASLVAFRGLLSVVLRLW